MMLDKKQIQVIFLFKFKTGRKAGETSSNINNTFSPGTANKSAVHSWFKKFYKGDERLEVEEHSGQPAEVDNQLRAIIKADPLIATWEVSEDLSINHTMAIWHLKQIGKLKRLHKWVPHELTVNKISHHCEVSSSFILRNSNEQSLDGIAMCDEKWILYDSWRQPAQRLDWETPKHFPKANLYQKRSWSLFGGLLPIWSTTASWIPAKPLHQRSMPSKLKKCTENCNACRCSPVNRKGPVLHDNTWPHITQAMLQKLNEMGYDVLSHLPYLPELIPTNYHFSSKSTTFFRENASTTSRRWKILSKRS